MTDPHSPGQDHPVHVLVVGDVLLDVDAVGTARRLSPDGPVPVVDVAEESDRPGGAALAALLLSHSGHRVTLVTSLGDDDAAARLRDGLGEVRILSDGAAHATPVKKRLIADGQVVARMDENCRSAETPAVSPGMLTALADADVDAVLVSDYGRGLTSDPRLREALTAAAGRIPVVWDPHPLGAPPVEATTVVTPNLREARDESGSEESGTRGLARTASLLLERWPADAAVITLGDRGAAVFERGDGLPRFIRAQRSTAGDACGAGDRFAGALAVQLARQVPLDDAAEAAVRVAGEYIARGGVASLGQETADDPLAARLAEVRAADGVVVATGGCFDLLHAGHARTLSAARSLGDFLIVCLNSDDSVRRLKGDQRPIMAEGDRVELLEALECVDAVVVFDEDTPEAVLDRLRPDVWVKGGDYDIDSLPEARLIRSWGGQAVTVPYLPARSTTHLAAALSSVG